MTELRERNDFCTENGFKETFRRLKGQPIEVITESGFKFCGIDVESDDDSILIIDDKGRLVRIANRHIDAVIESQKKLDRICKDNDCDCHDKHDCD